ncbi:DUF485 domain-containing protein [Marisediminicola sp. LYQ134]|uniref:DUF485 domain-containing protein n=1 Tax=Marisediminicola sp. LYQ134 TaxID=3391061 RepID=UPI003983A150
MTDVPLDDPPVSKVDYLAVAQSETFLRLKKRHRSFTFPLAVFFILWYFTFVLLAAYAPDVMATPVIGDINIGLILGLGQFVTTFAITMGYVAFANRKLDPLSAQLRSEMEGVERS